MSWRAESFRHEIVAASHHGYSRDRRIQEEGPQAVMDEITAGVKRDYHHVWLHRLWNRSQVGWLLDYAGLRSPLLADFGGVQYLNNHRGEIATLDLMFNILHAALSLGVDLQRCRGGAVC